MEDYSLKSKEEIISELKELKEKYKILSDSVKNNRQNELINNRLQTLADMLPQTVFEIDVTGRITYANKHAFNMFGCTEEDIKKGIYATDFIDVKDVLRTKQNIKLAINNIFENNKEYIAKTINGRTFPVLVYTNIIKENENVIGLRGIIVDITASKKKDEQLSLMNTVITKAEQPISWIDKEGTILFFNEKACKLFSASHEDIIGKKIWNFSPGITKEDWDTTWSRVKAEKQIISFDSMTDKNGQCTYIENYSNYINIGSTELIFSYSLDITQRVESEEELQKISLAVKQSSNSVIITDTHGIIEYINPKFTSTTGYTPEEAIGRKTSIIKSGYVDEKVYNVLWNTLLSGNEWQGELLNKKKNGKLFWESIVISPVKDKNGRITNFIAVKEDISEKKELELELKRALDRAEESSKLKSSLLANMNHEIRTPLTGILGMAQILNEELKEPFLLQFSKNIIISGKRLMATLNAILDLSELEAEAIKITNSEFILSDQLKLVLEPYIETAESKGLYFKLEFNDKDSLALTDPKLCNQILINLVDNAVKYTNSGGVHVKVNPVVYENKKWLQVIVKDTGIGISKKDQEIIFEEFRQLSEGLNRAFEGSGLGLALVKKMINLIDGRIEIKSELGFGSEFIVYFPSLFNEEDSGYTIQETPKIQPLQTTTGSEDLPKALLVEDNEINTEVVLNFLNKTCNLDHAYEGIEALKLASKKQYEIVLMDINLGTGMDGVQVAKELRKLPCYQHTPIIAVTGYAMSADRKKFLANGIDYYLAKPFSKDELVNMVNEILEKGSKADCS